MCLVMAPDGTWRRCLFLGQRKARQRRAIAHILSTLDDKIELNRRMSETLEQMARAIFKAWFVDFEPVHVKVGGKRHLLSLWERGQGEGRSDGIKLPLPTDLREFARELRRHGTDAEKLLWQYLRNRRMAGVKFRRQHPIPPHVLDLYCPDARLAIELDGGQHNEDAHPPRRDERCDAYLAECGIYVLRFWNNPVLRETQAVLEAIYAAIMERRAMARPPQPLSQWERGVYGCNAFLISFSWSARGFGVGRHSGRVGGGYFEVVGLVREAEDPLESRMWCSITLASPRTMKANGQSVSTARASGA